MSVLGVSVFVSGKVSCESVYWVSVCMCMWKV